MTKRFPRDIAELYVPLLGFTQCALRMTWKGLHPTMKRLEGEYPDGVRVAAREMKEYEARLQRSATLPKYDITINPRTTEPG